MRPRLIFSFFFFFWARYNLCNIPPFAIPSRSPYLAGAIGRLTCGRGVLDVAFPRTLPGRGREYLQGCAEACASGLDASWKSHESSRAISALKARFNQNQSPLSCFCYLSIQRVLW